MDVDPIFKGATRPAMMLGVPLYPLIFVCLGIMMVATWTNFLLNLLVLPAVLIMRAIVSQDDQKFRSIGFYLQFRLVHFDRNRKAWKGSSYSPIPRAQRQRK